jgi:AcrR family transcriptional regulator
MAARSTPKSTYHHGDLRQALLDAALAAVDRDGADAVSLAALARALKVSQAAPYRHFADRETLLASVAAEGFRLFCAALRAAQGGRARQAPLIRMCHAYLDFGRDRPGLYRLMFASRLLAVAPKDGELALVAAESFGLLVAALPLDAAARRERMATKIWVALHGTVMLAGEGLLGERPAENTLDALVEDIVGEPGDN